MIVIKVETYLGDIGIIEAEPYTLIKDIKLSIEEIFDIDITDQLLYAIDNDIRTLIESSTIDHINNIFVDLDVPGLLTEEEHKDLFSGNVSFLKK
jgi:hypothetical protein